jgi:transketolase C-terminal domain/subunit
MTFNSELFNSVYMEVITVGIAAGFAIGFITWAIGFAIYGIIKFFKMA